MSALFSAAVGLAVLLLHISPWLSLIVLVGFWFLPFRTILRLLLPISREGSINKPFRSRTEQDESDRLP